MAAPTANRKRSHSQSDNEEVLPHIVKKLKTHDDHVSKKKRRAGRSVPQHCRGTAIRPSQDVATQQPSRTSTRLPDSHDHLSPRPQTSSSAGEEFYDASSVAILDVASEGRETSQVTEGQRQQTGAGKGLKKQIMDNVQDDDAPEDQEMIIDDVIVNPIGRPGPRRRKKPKRVSNVQAQERREDAADARAKDSQALAEKASVLDNAGSKDAAVLMSATSTKTPVNLAAQTMQSAEEPHSPKLNYHKASRLGRDLIHRFKAAFENEKDPAKRKALRTKFILANDIELKEKPPQSASQQQAEMIPESSSNDVPAQPQKIVPEQPPKTTQAPKPISPPPAQADRIPTPTSLESHGHIADEDNVEPAVDVGGDAVVDNADVRDTPYDHRGTGYVDPTNQISEWLDHPQSPAPPDEVPPSMGSPKQTKPKQTDPKQTKSKPTNPKQTKKTQKSSTQKRESKKKSMARVDYSDDDYQDDREENQDGSEAEAEKKPEQNKQRGLVKGAWSEEEKALADSVFSNCCREFDLTPYDMKAQMGDWPGVEKGFRDDIYAAFPFRQIKAIRNFCQRRYHINNTGPWTEEEDQQLRHLYARCRDRDGREGYWVEIASEVGRSAQACRDRWKNIVGIEDTANLGPWTTGEEDGLIQAVDKHLFEDLKAALPGGGHGTTQEELEKMADWNRIAEYMQGKRSAKRCREKWRALKRRYADTEDLSLQQTTRQAEERPPGQALSKKQKGVETAYNKLGWADVYDALTEIFEAFSLRDYDKDFEYESTFWSVVASRVAKSNPESKFKPTPKLRRRCYYGALEKFGNEFVEGSAGFARRAGLLSDEMLRAKERDEVVWSRTLVPKPKMSTGKKRASQKEETVGTNVEAARFIAATTLKNAKQHLSAELVYDSDDEFDPEPNDSPRKDDVIEVPETQEEEAIAGAEIEAEDADMETIDEYPMSSINSRYDYAASLRSKTPKLNHKAFIERCRAGAGRT